MTLVGPELAAACGLVLAVVLAWAGAAKVVAPSETVASFAALGIPAPRALGRVVPVGELALAGALVAGLPGAAIAALALLAAFTAVLARVLRSGLRVVCSCFGAARREPVSSVDLARNGLLGLLGLGALGTTGGLPGLAALVLVSTAAALGWVALGVATLARVAPLWPSEPQR